jgi:hypothetical protein
MQTKPQAEPQACPFCVGIGIKRVLDNHEITGLIPGSEPLSGLNAYMCMHGHVFFVADEKCASLFSEKVRSSG